MMLRVAALFAAAAFFCCHDSGWAGTTEHLAWTGREGGKAYILYESSAKPGEVMAVTEGVTDVITPALCRDGDGRLWIFWIGREPEGRSLFASAMTGGGWEPPSLLATGGMPASHPTAALDGEGVLWLAWTGFDGRDDDIFVMSLKNGAWSSPARVGRDDDVPDVHPVLGVSEEGLPWLYWRGFDGRGYRGYVSRWGPKGWGPEEALGYEDSYRTRIFQELQGIRSSIRPDDREGIAVYREDGMVPLLPLRLEEALR